MHCSSLSNLFLSIKTVESQVKCVFWDETYKKPMILPTIKDVILNEECCFYGGQRDTIVSMAANEILLSLEIARIVQDGFPQKWSQTLEICTEMPEVESQNCCFSR